MAGWWRQPHQFTPRRPADHVLLVYRGSFFSSGVDMMN
jgi:hypothetical protein